MKTGRNFFISLTCFKRDSKSLAETLYLSIYICWSLSIEIVIPPVTSLGDSDAFGKAISTPACIIGADIIKTINGKQILKHEIEGIAYTHDKKAKGHTITLKNGDIEYVTDEEAAKLYKSMDIQSDERVQGYGGISKWKKLRSL